MLLIVVLLLELMEQSRNPYDDEERYHEREEYGHRERGRYGRY